MELPHIGKQCSAPDCKQLDFLPFKCNCNLIFCRDHFLQHTEICLKREQTDSESKSVNQYYKCSEKDCTNKSIIPLICEKCNKHFCISHRHINACNKIDEKALQEAIDQCNAPKKQFEEAKAVVDKEVESNINKAKRKEKNVETANKVQLMRLKAKATGPKSIPVTDRVYFLIFNKKYASNGQSVFISRDWTIGRSIDAIAEECKIPNNNNKSLAPKLRLFNRDNQCLTNNMSDKISTLISKSVIINGDSLIFDYVEN